MRKKQRAVRVNFFRGDNHANTSNTNLDHREYEYFYVKDDVVITDKCYAVVEVQGVMKITKVVREVAYSDKASKYAIAVFNLEDHKKRISEQEEYLALKEAAYNRAQEAKEREGLRKLAESDDVLKDMLIRLDEMENNIK